MTRKAQHLDGQHGKHAGHEVENQPANQSAQQCGPDTGVAGAGGGRCSRRIFVGFKRSGQSGGDAGHHGRRPLPRYIQRAAPGNGLALAHRCDAVLVGERDDDGQLLGRFATHVRQRDALSHPHIALPALLPVLAGLGGMPEGFGVFGVELQRLALKGGWQACDAQADAVIQHRALGCIGIGLNAGLAVIAQRCRQLGLRLEEVFAMGGGAAAHGNLQRELSAFGNAFHAADQPAGRQAYLHHAGFRRLEVAGNLDRNGQQHGVFVAVIDQRAYAQGVGRGPVNGSSAQTGGKLPLQFGGQAGVAGVLPVGVPVGLMGQLEAQPEGLACGNPIGRLRHQFGAHAWCLHHGGRGAGFAAG